MAVVQLMPAIFTPRVITVDKNAAYPVAIDALKADETIEQETELRQSKYLNNVVEQNHRSSACKTNDGI
jgi:transposase-like protein